MDELWLLDWRASSNTSFKAELVPVVACAAAGSFFLRYGHLCTQSLLQTRLSAVREMPSEIAASLCGSENLDWMSCMVTFSGERPNWMIRAVLAVLVAREDQDARFVIRHTRGAERRTLVAGTVLWSRTFMHHSKGTCYIKLINRV